jgi:uncharacterized protein
MNNTNLKLPVFPLPVFILPNGITRLRIFEARYLTLVKIATKEQGFIISLQTQPLKKSDETWGSWVEIINFDRGEDGVLEIEVKCKSLVKILSIDKNHQHLSFASVLALPHWSEKSKECNCYPLSTSLKLLFESDKTLNHLYHDKPTNDTHWVVARWLEFLPVKLAIKHTFIFDRSFQEAESFVQSIILKN